ncbi:hypothetical protein V491_00869 [Pseudogymnoascus sp. VKM F-3775]|nr:hypothetical protein V491_00869 [Pseudogymnoascus sp. VKM F-3775]
MSAAQVSTETSDWLPHGNARGISPHLLFGVMVIGRGLDLAANAAFEADKGVRSVVSRRRVVGNLRIREANAFAVHTRLTLG